VLRKMRELKMITPEQAEKAIAKKVDTDSVKGSKFFTARREKYFFDYVKDELLKEYGAKTVRQGGLKVYTTIDLAKQKAARAAIRRNLAGVGPSSAIVTIDPKNGYIRTMASSAAYGDSKFNLAAQGQAPARLGVQDLHADDRAAPGRGPAGHDIRLSLADDGQGPAVPGYEVNTYSRTGGGSMDLVRATLKSDNSAYIQLALDLGPDQVAKTARDLGVRSKLNGYCAETLGGLEDGVSPLEMANAYATIVSGGWRHRPTAVKKIVFPDGRTEQGKKLPERFRVKRAKAFEAPATYEAVKILEKNISAPGTGARAAIGCPAGGKTGTTDKNTDAWFVGFTPEALDRGVGRLPERPHADERAVQRRQRRRRHVPRPDLVGLHEEGQGQVLRRLQEARPAVPGVAVLRQERLDRQQAGRRGGRRRQRHDQPRHGWRRWGPERRHDLRPHALRGRPAEGARDPETGEGPGREAGRGALRRRRRRQPRGGWGRSRAQRVAPAAIHRPVRTVGFGGMSMREGSARQHHLAHLSRNEEVLYGNRCRQVVQ
jgi:membrane peptidoglycan carboxypeptidase